MNHLPRLFNTLFCSLIGFVAIAEQDSTKTEVNWAIVFDGQNRVDPGVLAVDEEGNSYFGLHNCGYQLTIPQLNAEMPPAGHVSRILIKVNKSGRIQWVRPMASEFDGRFQNMAICKNGDVIMSGFCDGESEYPDENDTLRLGKDRPRQPYQTHRNQYVFIARYTPNGERVFAKQFKSAWGESGGLATNSKDEIFWSFFHQGTLEYNGKTIQDRPGYGHSDKRFPLMKLSPDGEKFKFVNHGLQAQSNQAPGIRIDHDDNIILYGWYKSKIQFSPTDSLTNDAYQSGYDSYVVKYTPDFKLMWYRHLYGRSSQAIHDLRIDSSNGIWMTGAYSWECILSEKVAVSSRSEYNYKSGNSMFYVRLKADGTTDYSVFRSSPGYNSTIEPKAMAIDNKGYAYVGGYYTHDLSFGTSTTIKGRDYPCSEFTSIWAGDSLISFQRDIDIDSAWSNLLMMDIGGDNMVYAVLYNGPSEVRSINGKSWVLTDEQYGRSTVLVGSALPPLESIEHEDDSSAIQDLLVSLEEIEECLSPKYAIDPYVWYRIELDLDTIEAKIEYTETPGCGVKLKSSKVVLYPNPTSDIANLDLEGFNGNVTITMLSQKGDVLLTQLLRMKEGKESLSLDVSSLAKGMYYVVVTQNGFQKSLKLVKQ